MVAPIIGYGVCEKCGEKVAHRLNNAPTRHCGEKCRKASFAIKHREAIRRRVRERGHGNSGRRIKRLKRFAENALALKEYEHGGQTTI